MNVETIRAFRVELEKVAATRWKKALETGEIGMEELLSRIPQPPGRRAEPSLQQLSRRFMPLGDRPPPPTELQTMIARKRRAAVGALLDRTPPSSMRGQILDQAGVTNADISNHQYMKEMGRSLDEYKERRRTRLAEIMGHSKPAPVPAFAPTPSPVVPSVSSAAPAIEPQEPMTLGGILRDANPEVAARADAAKNGPSFRYSAPSSGSVTPPKEPSVAPYIAGGTALGVTAGAVHHYRKSKKSESAATLLVKKGLLRPF